MGRMKLGIAVAGVAMTLLGIVALATMRSDGSAHHANTAASGISQDATVPAETTAPTSAPATQPATTVKAAPNTATPPTTKAPAAKTPPLALPAQPTAQDIQKVIAGITSEVLAPANTSASTAPLTKEEVEAKVREQLKQLGITF